jgi:hypothetical protein
MSVSAVAPGQRFGLWTVLGADYSSRRASCQCRCGVVRQATFYALLNGESRGCGGCTRPTKDEMNRVKHERRRGRLVDWRPGR